MKEPSLLSSFVARELQDIQVPYGPQECCVSCIQIDNFTSTFHEKYTCEARLYKNKPLESIRLSEGPFHFGFLGKLFMDLTDLAGYF